MKKNKKNLSEAINDEEFKNEAELAVNDEESIEEVKEKPILTEQELKVRKAKRTRFAVAAFVLLFGVGIMGNWYYQNSDFSASVKPLVTSSDTKTLGEAEYVDAPTTVSSEESKYFSEARVNRETARDKAIEELQSVIDKADASSEAKNQASAAMSDISKYISIENKIETLVAAKGVNNVLAVISEDGKKVDIIVDVKDLDDTVIMQIKDIAMQQLNCSFEDITIIQSNNSEQ